MSSDEIPPSTSSQHREQETLTRNDGDRSSSSDDMDIASSKFDPLLALYSPHFPLESDSPVFDNVEKFVAVYTNKAKDAKKKAKQQANPQPTSTEREIPPEQLAGTSSKRRQQGNVLTFMAAQSAEGAGPMSLLARCVRDKLRVTVVTRGPGRVRGRLSAYLLAFDKHWNLALGDVDEEFTRKRHGKPCLNGTKESDSSLSPRSETMGDCIVRVDKCRRKTLQCRRHAHQLLLRGEHVVLVATNDSVISSSRSVAAKAKCD